MHQAPAPRLSSAPKVSSRWLSTAGLRRLALASLLPGLWLTSAEAGAPTARTDAEEYPSGTWHVWWPISPWSPMAIYQLKLSLTGGVGAFKLWPQSITAGCDDYTGACPCFEGIAWYSGNTLSLEGGECGGVSSGVFTATAIGQGPVMDIETWMDNGDGTGGGVSTIMRKLALF